MEAKRPSSCATCGSTGAFLELPTCGHRFHARCIFSWPIDHCEACSTKASTVVVCRPFLGKRNAMSRKGKWGADEHAYANLMMKQFQRGALPLPNGLHLRTFLSNLLQCDPLRVTKKYAGQAIGKQNFQLQQERGYCFNVHVNLQKKISRLRNHYYWHIQSHEKDAKSINELKDAEADYWIAEFLKFAKAMNQPVDAPAEALAAATKKKRQRRQVPVLRTKSSKTDTDSRPSSASSSEEVERPPWEVHMSQSQESSFAPSAATKRSVSPLGFDEWDDPTLSIVQTLENLRATIQFSQEETPTVVASQPDSMEELGTSIDTFTPPEVAQP